jgi:hypothetical protein
MSHPDEFEEVDNEQHSGINGGQSTNASIEPDDPHKGAIS